MAQLSDDCFAFGGPLLRVADAIGLINARIAAVTETETVSLAAAAGRIAARDVAHLHAGLREDQRLRRFGNVQRRQQGP